MNLYFKPLVLILFYSPRVKLIFTSKKEISSSSVSSKLSLNVACNVRLVSRIPFISLGVCCAIGRWPSAMKIYEKSGRSFFRPTFTQRSAVSHWTVSDGKAAFERTGEYRSLPTYFTPGSLGTARETRGRERGVEEEERRKEREREREISLITRVLHISAIFFYFT